MNLDTAELREQIRESLPLAELMGRDVTLRREGAGKWRCLCPFHAEKSPSFLIGGKTPNRGHCFGCGEDVDVFAYWMKTRDVEWRQCLVELGDMAGVRVPEELRDPNFKPSAPRPAVRAPKRLVESDSVKPSLPPFRCLRPAECEQLAAVRGLSVDAVRHAQFTARVIGFSMWPLYEERMRNAEGERNWFPRSQGAWPSWVATDDTRHTAEFRRLDGSKYQRWDGGEIKAWSTAGKNWPLGVGQIGHKVNILLVEGGPDMLAAFHFLMRWGMIEHVAVVCMLGASNSIRASARPAFKGKRVRIMQDADLPKDPPEPLPGQRPKRREMPGAEASARWTKELTEAGAVVESFCVGPIYDNASVAAWGRREIGAADMVIEVPGLTLPDGRAVNDLNDLALCAEEVRDAPEVRDAFCVWDF